MNTLRYPFYLLLAGLMAVSLTACDQSSQNIGFEPGENLTITGPTSATIPNYDSTAYIKEGDNPPNPADSTVAQYYVNAFTIEQEYSWSLSGADGAEAMGTRRDGEYYQVSPTDVPGTYSVTVTTTIDGEEVSGQIATESDYPPASEQAEKRGLTILASAASNAGLLGVLDSDEDEVLGGYTAFAPENEAFLDALDDDGDGTLSEDELPAPGIMADILRYHASPDSLPTGVINSDEYTAGDPIPTALPGEVVSVNPTGPVSVNGSATSATVTEADVATSDGVIHVINDVLLPNALVSANDQEARRSSSQDTVTVGGAFLADGGFVVLHDSTELANDQVAGSVVGHSSYLSPGFHKNVTVITDGQLDVDPGNSKTITFMAHRDTDSDRSYDFNSSGGADDGPYVTSGSGSPVVDNASVSIPAN